MGKRGAAVGAHGRAGHRPPRIQMAGAKSRKLLRNFRCQSVVFCYTTREIPMCHCLCVGYLNGHILVGACTSKICVFCCVAEVSFQSP